MRSHTPISRPRVLALSMACALALPLAGHAQDTTREQQLEQRVAQLEQQLAELKQMVQAQRTAPAPPPAPAAPTAPAPAVATTEAKPAFTTAPGQSVAFHGFISASAFAQNRGFAFGNGQNAEWPATGAEGSLSGVDVRNTRFWFDFSGAKLNETWSGGGRIEADFFGGFNGTGPYSQQQPTPRLRQAYLDLTNGTGTTVRVGQQWDLMFPLDNVPTSLSHIAFPLGYGTGFIGWRFPGVVLMQELNHGSEGPKWRFDLGVFEGSWNGPGNNLNYETAGNVDFHPQLEARLRVQGADWLAYLVAHYSRVDLRGVNGSGATPIQRTVDSVGYELGGSWHPGPWMFKGLVYSGRGLGEIFGALAQFGDISENGGFVQAGYSFTPQWSVNAFYGMSKPNRDDVVAWLGNGATGSLRNRQAALSLQYAAGAYELGVEWIYAKLDATADGITRTTQSGNQLSLNALYHF